MSEVDVVNAGTRGRWIWRWICLSLSLGAAALCCPPLAHATPEIGSLDGRFVGIGGCGIAAADGAAGMFHNPALLVTGAGKGDFLVSAAFSYTRTTAPVAGPYQEQTESAASPAAFMAAAYRILPRLALGVAIQPTGGSGGSFRVNGSEVSAAAFALEADLGAAYAITDRFSLGVMYRIGYLASTAKSPDPATSSSTKATLSGGDFFAFTAGATYRFGNDHNPTRMGLYYRPSIAAEISGETETQFGNFDTVSRYAVPDKFQLGVSQALLNGRLLRSNWSTTLQKRSRRVRQSS